MKRVGLAVVTYKDNFGSALQTYATQYILNQIGYETRIFDINSVRRSITRRKMKYYFSRFWQKDERKYLLDNLVSRGRKKANVANDKYAENMQIRHQKYLEFNRKRLMFFPKVGGWRALAQQSRTCNHIVVGSDQLWRPSNIAGGFFTLDFVPDSVNKVALSTSFGVSSLPNHLYKKSTAFLNKINSISVRENTGKQIVKELTGRDVPVVCDPTMILDSGQWLAIQEKEPFLKGDYILMYFMGDNPNHRSFVKELKNKTGCRIVGLLHGATYVDSDEHFADEEPYNVGPSEFINLIRNAKYVCTDSFHGTVFSILNEKMFFSFRRYEDKSEFSTNDRLHTLLNWTGLSDRMLYGNENVDALLGMSIDWQSVQEKVASRRREAVDYLVNSLKNGEGNDSTSRKEQV